MQGVGYDVLGFPIFKGDNLKFALKLKEEYYVMKDTDQFKRVYKDIKKAIEEGKVSRELLLHNSLIRLKRESKNKGAYLAPSSGSWKDAISINRYSWG